MTRAIIRLSLDGDGGATHNDVRAALVTGAGFTRTGTSTYEYDGPEDAVLPALSQALAAIRRRRGGGAMDHLWVYITSNPAPAPVGHAANAAPDRGITPDD